MFRRALTYFSVSLRSISNASTIDAGELQHFKQFTREWWSEIGPMKPLHAMNKLRVPLIRNGVINTNHIPQSVADSSKPLRGISMLDVGCGGGILSESLARIGANVKGLDASYDMIEKAKAHTKTENIQYVCSSIEDHAKEFTETYDMVVASEILEHVTKKEEFLKACINCLKPGGSFFLTTVSKTIYSNIAAIILAEDLFHILPKGTHEYDKFIKPCKLQGMLEAHCCKTVFVHGIGYNVITNEWFWTSNTTVNYALHAVKLKNA